MDYRIAVFVAGLVWYCSAIEIDVDTVYTLYQPNAAAKLTIRNTSLTDSVYIDTLYVRDLSPIVNCDEIGFQSNARYGLSYDEFYPVKYINDTFFISKPANSRLGIRQGDSLILDKIEIGGCLRCVGIKGAIYPEQCILKALFIPTRGSKDSVVFIGPRISGGTKFKSSPNRAAIAKAIAGVELYDLSGRRVANAKSMKRGVYLLISTRQGVVGKRLLIDRR
jgi:hypothetical protein